MLDINKVFYLEDDCLNEVSVKRYINIWNREERENVKYEPIHVDSLMEIDDKGIVFFNKRINDSTFHLVDDFLTNNPSRNICFFVTPMDIKFINRLNNLGDKFEHANIGTILQPAQFSRVEQFLLSSINRTEALELEDGWEEFTFDDLKL